MKNYTYTIRIDIKKFYALEYNPTTKRSDPIQLPFIYDGEEHGVFLYRCFDKQEEAKIFFEMLSGFCTASEIEISVDKSIINEKDTVAGEKELSKFTLKDELYPENKIKKYCEEIDWDAEVDLFNHSEEVEKVSK